MRFLLTTAFLLCCCHVYGQIEPTPFCKPVTVTDAPPFIVHPPDGEDPAVCCDVVGLKWGSPNTYAETMLRLRQRCQLPDGTWDDWYIVDRITVPEEFEGPGTYTEVYYAKIFNCEQVCLFAMDLYTTEYGWVYVLDSGAAVECGGIECDEFAVGPLALARSIANCDRPAI